MYKQCQYENCKLTILSARDFLKPKLLSRKYTYKIEENYPIFVLGRGITVREQRPKMRPGKWLFCVAKLRRWRFWHQTIGFYSPYRSLAVTHRLTKGWKVPERRPKVHASLFTRSVRTFINGEHIFVKVPIKTKFMFYFVSAASQGVPKV